MADRALVMEAEVVLVRQRADALRATAGLSA